MRTLEPSPREPDLVERLGELFAPRIGRGSTYRRSEVGGAAAATRSRFEHALAGALAEGDGPLLLYIAAHGEQGEQPRDNYAVLWGGGSLTVARLAELHDKAPRPLRAVITSCYSGGFAELAFAAADPRQGPARPGRCGLFAGTWDRQTSGCDPNPDRRSQEGYSLHFLNALQGRDRDGGKLPLAELDLDGDGSVSPLEAHARARIASRSIDVPTTTSERYLREVVTAGAGLRPGLLPEEQAVVERLGAALGIDNQGQAQARLTELDRTLDALDARLEETEEALDLAYRTLSTALLERWPVLDDAYHADFRETVETHALAIEQMLTGSTEARRYAEASKAATALDQGLWQLQVREALLVRLLRAHETLALASALARKGGPQLAQYEALLACERAPF